MRYIGFSTGALAKENVQKALEMLANKPVDAIELSALRQQELLPLVNQIDKLDLSRFKYISFHAPSELEASFEREALKALEKVGSRGWPIIVHPNVIHTPSDWARFGELLYVENMDKRKPIGQTAAHLARLFDLLPKASLCLDLGHVRQVDPTMSEAAQILFRFRARTRQLHVSEVNAQSKHNALTLEAMMAFQRVSDLLPEDAPIILESRVSESEITAEIQNALHALEPTNVAASAD